jgi:hypothetical protein
MTPDIASLEIEKIALRVFACFIWLFAVGMLVWACLIAWWLALFVAVPYCGALFTFGGFAWCLSCEPDIVRGWYL